MDVAGPHTHAVLWEGDRGSQSAGMPCYVAAAAEQKVSPPNRPLWHVDYFELMALKKELVREGHWDPPWSLLKQKLTLPCDRHRPCPRRGKGILTTRAGEHGAEKSVQTSPVFLVTSSPFTTPRPKPFVLSIPYKFIF